MSRVKPTIVMLSLSIAGCISTKVPMDYSKYSAYSAANPGNKDFDEVGPVEGKSSSWSFGNCQALVESAMADMVAAAKSVNANAIYGVKFHTTPDGTPGCKRRFGLLVFFIPFWANSYVTGTAARVKGPVTPATNALRFDEHSVPRDVARAYLEKIGVESL